MEFLEPDKYVRFKTVNYKDQIAVLIGGFKSDEDARKALDKVRTWPAPSTKVKDHLGRDVLLMDCGTIFRPGPDGKQMLQESPINPFATASVVPNPTVERPVQVSSGKVRSFPRETERGASLQSAHCDQDLDSRREVVHRAGRNRRTRFEHGRGEEVRLQQGG